MSRYRRNQFLLLVTLGAAAVASAQAPESAPPPAARENTDVEDKVAQQLRTYAAVGSRDIRVVADRLTNTITLSGTVSSEEEKERAGQIAVKTFPVGQVRNQLEVRQRL